MVTPGQFASGPLLVTAVEPLTAGHTAKPLALLHLVDGFVVDGFAADLTTGSVGPLSVLDEGRVLLLAALVRLGLAFGRPLQRRVEVVVRLCAADIRQKGTPGNRERFGSLVDHVPFDDMREHLKPKKMLEKKFMNQLKITTRVII